MCNWFTGFCWVYVCVFGCWAICCDDGLWWVATVWFGCVYYDCLGMINFDTYPLVELFVVSFVFINFVLTDVYV